MGISKFLAILTLLISISEYFSTVDAKSILKVRFVSYGNPGNRIENGNCCDGAYPVIGGCLPNCCDPYFKICLDRYDSGSSSINTCPLGRLVSGVVDRNRKEFSFDSSFGGLSNPIEFMVTTDMNVPLLLKIQVMDDDHLSSDDVVANFQKKIALAIWETPMSVTLQRGGTSLVFELEAACAPNYHGDDCSTYCEGDCDDEPCPTDYYGPNCSVYCALPGLFDHYKCNYFTGAKICEEGWFGEDCSNQSQGQYP